MGKTLTAAAPMALGKREEAADRIVDQPKIRVVPIIQMQEKAEMIPMAVQRVSGLDRLMP